MAQLAVNQTPTPVERWEFWRDRTLILQFRFKAALKVAIVFTSLCKKSLLRVRFYVESQESALEDMREVSVMMRFNDNQRRNPQ